MGNGASPNGPSYRAHLRLYRLYGPAVRCKRLGIEQIAHYRSQARGSFKHYDFLEATIQLCKVGAMLREKCGFRPNDYGIEPFPCWRRSPRYWLRINAAMENQKC
jgi:hypothetical protein